jgi:hypothetical protein
MRGSSSRTAIEKNGYFYEGNPIISNSLGEIVQKSIGEEHILCHRLFFVARESGVKRALRRVLVTLSLVPCSAKKPD